MFKIVKASKIQSNILFLINARHAKLWSTLIHLIKCIYNWIKLVLSRSMSSMTLHENNHISDCLSTLDDCHNGKFFKENWSNKLALQQWSSVEQKKPKNFPWKNGVCGKMDAWRHKNVIWGGLIVKSTDFGRSHDFSSCFCLIYEC